MLHTASIPGFIVISTKVINKFLNRAKAIRSECIEVTRKEKKPFPASIRVLSGLSLLPHLVQATQKLAGFVCSSAAFGAFLFPSPQKPSYVFLLVLFPAVPPEMQSPGSSL